MAIPLFPDHCVLQVETYADRIEVHWSKQHGEWLRKLGVAGMATLGFLGLGVCLHDMAKREWFTLAWHCWMIAPSFFISLRYLHRQTEGTGGGILRIESERLLFLPGGFKIPMVYARSEVLRVVQLGKAKVQVTARVTPRRRLRNLTDHLLGRFPQSNVQVPTGGPVERDWLEEVLKRWHAGTLFDLKDGIHAPR